MSWFESGGGKSYPQAIKQVAFITDVYSQEATKTFTIPDGYKNKKGLIIVTCTSNGHLLKLSFKHSGSLNSVDCLNEKIGNNCTVFSGNGEAIVNSGDTVTITYKTNVTQTFYIEAFVVVA